MGTDKEWLQSTIIDAATSSPTLFAQADLDAVKTDATFLDKFIQARSSKEDSLKMVLSTLRWRKEFRPDNDGGENSSICFSHKTDLDGRPIVVVHFARVTCESDAAEMNAERAIAFTLEKLKKSEARICLLVDARGCHPQRFSSRVCQFLISCFETYYPCLLGPVLVYGLPWRMRPTWAIVRDLLPPGCLASIRSVPDADALHRYVNSSDLSPALADQVTFASPMRDDGGEDRALPSALRQHDLKSPDSGRRVTFAQTSPGPGEVPQTQLARLSPPKELIFTGDNLLGASLTITNTAPNPIAFKIKTTSPTSYRVRPNNGILAIGATASIDISRRSISPLNEKFRDKFLVMVTHSGALDSTHTHEVISDYFRTLARGQITEFRLYTNYTGGAPPGQSATETAAARARAAEAEVFSTLTDSLAEPRQRIGVRNSVATTSFISGGATRKGSSASATSCEPVGTTASPAPLTAPPSSRLSTVLTAAMFTSLGWVGATLTQFPVAKLEAVGVDVLILTLIVGLLIGVALDVLRIRLFAEKTKRE
eukprot:m.101605 g.101605  ORF g.101605 m.101605 type:complete len:540 (+) comp12514_c0_seq1:223-1842(+)